MGRSVVTDATDRCEACRQAPRWCICAGRREVVCPFDLEVLIHQAEYWRPTSTGRLLGRVVRGARTHVFQPEAPPVGGTIRRPGGELWVLHPRGSPLPAGPVPPGLQVMVLDGNWREASRMAEATAGWGRRVALRAAGASRYGLRVSPRADNYATAEALILLLEEMGAAGPAQALREQFELHVYAALRTRGSKVQAEAFVAASTLPQAFPELIAELNRRRRND